MFVAGIDVGLENTKVVVLHRGRTVSHAVIPVGGETAEAVAWRGLEEAARKAGILTRDVGYAVATGAGRGDISFATEQMAEIFCLPRGLSHELPSARTAIDVGAEKTLVVRFDRGRPSRYVTNDKCASGAGIYLEMVAKILGLELEETGELSLRSRQPVEVLSACAVFAESEIISLVHQRKRPEDILRGLFQGLAYRLYTLLLSVGFERDVVMVGGVARNAGVVAALRHQLGCEILIPKEPELVGALGAALLAEERMTPGAWRPPGRPRLQSEELKGPGGFGEAKAKIRT